VYLLVYVVKKPSPSPQLNELYLARQISDFEPTVETNIEIKYLFLELKKNPV
jgi:hypothetical protein